MDGHTWKTEKLAITDLSKENYGPLTRREVVDIPHITVTKLCKVRRALAQICDISSIIAF